MPWRGSVLAIVNVLLRAASGGAGFADPFTDDMEHLSSQKVSAIGRDAMVSAYERLLMDYLDHPERAKAMLEFHSIRQAGASPAAGCQKAASSCAIELPRDTKAIIDPGKLRAEPVIPGRHEDRTTVRESSERLIQLGLALALHE
jgi:hypothetical protein